MVERLLWYMRLLQIKWYRHIIYIEYVYEPNHLGYAIGQVLRTSEECR